MWITRSLWTGEYLEECDTVYNKQAVNCTAPSDPFRRMAIVEISRTMQQAATYLQQWNSGPHGWNAEKQKRSTHKQALTSLKWI
jgi:hypothetical protein